MIGIYKITNIANDMIYIGQSTNMENRWKTHISALRHRRHFNDHMQRAFNKYGEQNFKFEVVEECNENILTEREHFFIGYYNSMDYNFGYNKKEAGDQGRLSEDIKHKMSESRKGEKNPNYGKRMSEEAKKKMSECLKKVSYKLRISEEKRKKMVEGIRRNRKPMSDEQKKQISESKKGKPSTFKGKHFSEESRQKLSRSRKGKCCGEQHANCKISEEIAKEIVRLSLECVQPKIIADRFNTTISTIKMIKQKRAWTHLTKDIEFPICSHKRGV